MWVQVAVMGGKSWMEWGTRQVMQSFVSCCMLDSTLGERLDR